MRRMIDLVDGKLALVKRQTRTARAHIVVDLVFETDADVVHAQSVLDCALVTLGTIGTVTDTYEIRRA